MKEWKFNGNNHVRELSDGNFLSYNDDIGLNISEEPELAIMKIINGDRNLAIIYGANMDDFDSIDNFDDALDLAIAKVKEGIYALWLFYDKRTKTLYRCQLPSR